MLTLVCHRCGFTTGPGHAHVHGRVRCPADGLFLVDEDDHRRAPRDAYLGTILGNRYPILGLIGQGGMGSVYRSIQPPVERPVAIKVIHPRVSLEDTLVEADTEEADDVAARFLREAKLIAAMNHPNIVTMHDFGTEPDGTLYMVQELLEGDSLRRALPVLSPRTLVAVLIELLDALEAAHKRGLVHRDVKPENIMLLHGWQANGVRPRVKLLDFGIARRVGPDEAGRLTTQGAIFGTPMYMAPEQAQGSDQVDARADLYAVGILLYEGLAGRPPYAGPNALAILMQVLHGERPPVQARGPLPARLNAILDRALERKPEKRFQSAHEMAEALSRLEWPADDAVVLTSELASGHRTLPLSSRPRPAAAVADTVTPEEVLAGIQRADERSGSAVSPMAPTEPRLESLMARPPLAWRVGAAIVVGVLLGGVAWILLPRNHSAAPTVVPATSPPAPSTAPVSSAQPAGPPTTPAPATDLAVGSATRSASPTPPSDQAGRAPATAGRAPNPATAPPKRPRPPVSGTSTAEPEEILAPPPR